MLRGRFGAIPAALALAGAAGVLGSCAIQVAPDGGPKDETAPTLALIEPDSGATALAGTKEIVLTFSEKMEPQDAERFLFSYPPLEYEKTKWKGRRAAHVVLVDPLPADTVIVFELAPTLTDNHRVASRESKRWPVATGDGLPVGRLAGRLLSGGQGLDDGVVELYAVPPDTLEYFQQDRLRRAVTDSLGNWAFDWLPVPGGPWLVRAGNDANGDLRLAEGEGMRLLPGEFALTPETPFVDADTTTVYGPKTPGTFIGMVGTADSPAVAGDLWAWPETISDADTGFVAIGMKKAPVGLTRVLPGAETRISPAGPGLVRLVFFVDADGDSLPSVVGDPPDGAATIVRLEAMALVDSLTVEPGLTADFAAPSFPDTLPLWLPPDGWFDIPDTASTVTDSIPDLPETLESESK